MAKKNTIRTKSDAVRITKEMAAKNYSPLAKPDTFHPAPFGCGMPSGKDGGMQQFIESRLYADSSGSSCPTTGRIPSIFADGTAEIKGDTGNVGTDGLGYMSWGRNNNLPNSVAVLTELLPYMSASWKFNVDLATGIGPEPVYHYAQYVGGNVTEKDIPYESAGVLLKGWRLDILREITNLDDRQPFYQQYRQALTTRLAEIESDIDIWERTSKEVSDFFQRNNVLQTFLHLAADQVLLGMSFPEIDVQRTYIDPDTQHPVQTTMWKPKATAVRYRSAMTARVERMDENNRINYVYVSNRWLNSSVNCDTVATSPADMKIGAIRALDPFSPTASLKSILADTRRQNVSRKKRPTRFILPTRIASPGRPYYPIPPHFSVFAGGIYDYAYTMIENRATAKKNSRVIGYVIYIHNDYLQQYYMQEKADTPDSKKRVRDKLFSEINTFLSDRDNHGKPLVSIQFRDADGKTAKAWEIVEIEGDKKNTVEANERELQEISSIIFFSWGVDARLIGNSPGDVSSSGGTDLRERFLLKQIQMSPTQQLLLRPFYVVRDLNDWDTAHLRFRIRREVITTLDNSKTGLTSAQDG